MSTMTISAHGEGAEETPERRRKILATLALGALGVVYGDIGTSPLYAVRECVSGAHGLPPQPANVLGVLSLIFWSLTMVVSVKYLSFVMRADNKGEGGILALLGLSLGGAKPVAQMGALVALILFGTGLLYGDSAITPAISVLSAVEGLAVAAPALERWVMPLAIIVLIGLFSIQSRGTAKVGALFGPVMIVWFSVLAILGVVHIADNPSVLYALLPTYAIDFFVQNRMHGFLALGSVVLAFTGAEALYADMGHFGRVPIRLAWFGFVFPALLLNYFGQGAMLLQHPEVADTVFFSMVPRGPLTWALVLLSTAATIIASQALISGTFSLTSQAVQLGYFPRVTVRHTSALTRGQIYSPEVNWAMAAACLSLVIVFKSSGGLAAAYGVAVTGTLCITSVAFYFVARARFGWSRAKAGALLALFLCFDIPYFAANLVKIESGGYVPMLIGAAFFVVMVTWKKGRLLLARHFERNAVSIEAFQARIADEQVIRVAGTGVVMASAERFVPYILCSHVRHVHALHRTVILLTVQGASEARVEPADRVSATDLGAGMWRVIVRYGFMEETDVPAAMALAIRSYAIPARVGELTWIIGHETLLATDGGQMRRWQELLFAFLARNALPATAWFKLPPDNVLELGVRLDL